jgi:hypothetical protein
MVCRSSLLSLLQQFLDLSALHSLSAAFASETLVPSISMASLSFQSSTLL